MHSGKKNTGKEEVVKEIPILVFVCPGCNVLKPIRESSGFCRKCCEELEDGWEVFDIIEGEETKEN